MGIGISKIKKLFILTIYFLFSSLFLNIRDVKALDSCADVNCTWQPQSYCMCVPFVINRWNALTGEYEPVDKGRDCGCTRLNSDTFTCDGAWGSCFGYNGSCWQTRACSGGGTQIRK